MSTALISIPSLRAQYCTCPFWTCNRLKSWAGGRCRNTFDLSSLGVKGGQTPGGCWAGNKTQAGLELPSREPRSSAEEAAGRAAWARGGEGLCWAEDARALARWNPASWGLLTFLRQRIGKIRQLHWAQNWSHSFGNSIAKRSAVRKCWKAILIAIQEAFKERMFFNFFFPLAKLSWLGISPLQQDAVKALSQNRIWSISCDLWWNCIAPWRLRAVLQHRPESPENAYQVV